MVETPLLHIDPDIRSWQNYPTRLYVSNVCYLMLCDVRLRNIKSEKQGIWWFQIR